MKESGLIESPYGSLNDLQEEAERVPYGAADQDAPAMYSKDHSPEYELIPSILLEQTGHQTPDIFYDPVSEEVVSVGKTIDTVNLYDITRGEVERDVDIDSLLWASAQRGIIADQDTHEKQYAVTPDGTLYTFDFGGAGGESLDEQLTGGITNGIVGFTADMIRDLEAEELLMDSPGYHGREQVMNAVADEIEGRMRDMVEEIDLDQFVSEVEDHPYLRPDQYERGMAWDFRIDKLIENVEEIRSTEFEVTIEDNDSSRNSGETIEFENSSQDVREPVKTAFNGSLEKEYELREGWME